MVITDTIKRYLRNPYLQTSIIAIPYFQVSSIFLNHFAPVKNLIFSLWVLFSIFFLIFYFFIRRISHLEFENNTLKDENERLKKKK